MDAHDATPAKRWSVAFTAALMNALQAGAFFFTPTTVMPKIVEDFQLPLSLSTAPIAVGKVAYVLLLIPGGMLVDHFGPRIMVLLGIGGLAVILTFYALAARTFAALVVAHVLMATVASVSGVPVYSIFIAQWFRSGIGLAMGLVLAGYSAAGTFIPAILGPVAGRYGWRAAMGAVVGLLTFVGLPATYMFLQERDDGGGAPAPPSAPQQAASGADGGDAERAPLLRDGERDSGNSAAGGGGVPNRPLAAVKSWTFVGFAMSYILLQYCFGCFGENIMFFLTVDRDVPLGVASLFFSVLNLSAFSAKLVGGHLGDRYDRFYVASAASGLAAFGITFLFIGGGADAGAQTGSEGWALPGLTRQPAAAVVFAMLFGFGYGATFNCLYALTPLVFGRVGLGRTQSALFGLGLGGNAVGSVLTAVLRSRYGSYREAFAVAFVACLSNFFVFNANRLSLRGSVERMERDRRAARSRKDGAEAESGVVAQDGFPRPRDWSTQSLRRLASGEPDGDGGADGGSAGANGQGGMPRSSSTVEALIDSGILSATMEDVGYLGGEGGGEADVGRGAGV